jgi:hypothetical protein
VANVSGVAESAERLHASWAIVIITTKMMKDDFFIDMVFSAEWFSKDQRRPAGMNGSHFKNKPASAGLFCMMKR